VICILIPDQQPALVTGFASQADAKAWTDKHRQRVRATDKRAPFRFSASR